MASLRQQALTSLQLTWRDIHRLESLSDDPAESKVAGRALAFIDKAFAEFESKDLPVSREERLKNRDLSE